MKNNILNLIYSYECGFNLNGGLYLRCPTKEEACFAGNLFFDDWIETARNIKAAVEIFYGDHKIFQIQDYMNTGLGENTQMANEIWFGQDIGFSSELIRLALDICERPRAAGIVRLSDERQIMVHDAVSATLNFATPQESVSWTRSQYWGPQDLIDFRKRCEQELTADGQSTIEHKYLTFEPAKGMNDNSPGNWMEITSRYQLHEIAGQFYQLYETLEYKNVERPTDLRV